MTDGLIRTPMGHWVLAEDVSLAKYVEHFGTFEFPDNLNILRQVAPCIPDGGVVVNAGACIGDHTASYSQMVGARGLVFAFEPHPLSYQALVKNMARLRNVVTFQEALGAEPAASELSMTPNVGASFLRPDAQQEAFPTASVTITTLDKALLGVERLDFIHLDAEGYEPQIIAGADALIRKFRPALLIEVTDAWLKRYGSSEAALLMQLADYGYILKRLQPNPAQYDVLAVAA